MVALMIIWLISIFAVAFVAAIGLYLFILFYTLPYCFWIHKQHAVGQYTDWYKFSPKLATRLYFAKLTRSAI